MRCLKMLVIGISSWVLVCPAAITYAQLKSAAVLVKRSVAKVGRVICLLISDLIKCCMQMVHPKKASTLPTTIMSSRPVGPNPGAGSDRVTAWEGGNPYLSIRSGQSKRATKNESKIDLSAQSIPVDAILIAALVLAKAEDDAHAKVIVGQTRSSMMGGMGRGLGRDAGAGLGSRAECRAWVGA